MGNLQLGLHQVISFYYVAKEQSYSRAAEALSITQPAVTSIYVAWKCNMESNS